MKHNLISLIAIFFAFSYFAQDPVLMEVNNAPVTKSEFLQIYLKNNNNLDFCVKEAAIPVHRKPLRRRDSGAGLA